MCRAKRMSGISLGEDLETEILVRLPAKPLMRFKSVQRSWNVLFKTPTFVTRHMHMSDGYSLMILRDEKFHSFKHRDRITLLSCDNPTPTPTRTLTSPFPNNSCSARIFSHGHCNGIFCLEGSDSQLILWNPSTREVHLIPPPPSLRHGDESLYGFGADPNTNDFKVVKLNVCYNRMNSSADIYNLSTKSWAHIHRPALPHLPIITFRVRPSKYKSLVNGVYHWIACYNYDGVANILCFDFSNNRFSELRAPISHLVMGFVRDDVAEVNGSLAYVVQYHGPTRLEIWVMDQLSWAKKYSIGPFESTVCIRGIWKDGAQVLGGKFGQPLTAYDHDGNPIRQFQIDVDHGYSGFMSMCKAWPCQPS